MTAPLRSLASVRSYYFASFVCSTVAGSTITRWRIFAG